jgi:hypothetical protein
MHLEAGSGSTRLETYISLLVNVQNNILSCQIDVACICDAWPRYYALVYCPRVSSQGCLACILISSGEKGKMLIECLLISDNLNILV